MIHAITSRTVREESMSTVGSNQHFPISRLLEWNETSTNTLHKSIRRHTSMDVDEPSVREQMIQYELPHFITVIHEGI